jgi:hypothetical protein
MMMVEVGEREKLRMIDDVMDECGQPPGKCGQGSSVRGLLGRLYSKLV